MSLIGNPDRERAGLELWSRGFEAGKVSMKPALDALQAKIDELMLEYCPDEMTAEQLEEYGRHQVPVPKEMSDAIDAKLGIKRGG